ncbi:MAG: SPFH domain-containing protein [Myxococcota bacterium]
MGTVIVIFGALLGILGLAALVWVRNLIYICAPNEVLIFSGRREDRGGKAYGYRLVKGGRGVRVPLLEQVTRMDLTNMAIELTARSAYSKGGVPLTVQGVANVKIAGHEPLLNRAIERFMGRGRKDIMQTAKNTLEGSLRGVLATMTPEQVNEDRVLFAERLVQQVEDELAALGLIVDMLKIQNVHDDVSYLNSIGRKKNAEVVKFARISEAQAKAQSMIRSAENRQQEAEAKINMQIESAKAEAERKLTDALTRRDAVIAEEQATVRAEVARARADLEVQRARIEQVRHQLDADVIQPAKAACLAAEENAKAEVAPIIQDGNARAEALRTLAQSWERSGDHARDIFLLQKMEQVVAILTNLVQATTIDKVTMIDARVPSLGSGGDLALKALGSSEQIKQVLGVDILAKLGGSDPGGVTAPAPPALSARPAPPPPPPPKTK